MLNTERQSQRMERRVRSAARAAGIVTSRTAAVFFEHGQYWVENRTTGAQWSVCDADGPESAGIFDGFCFEQVTKGEEE